MKWLNSHRMRLVILGFIVSGFLNTAKVCSAAEYVWTQKADMPTPRWNLATCEVDGKIYAIGGESSEGPAYRVLSSTEEYDPATNTWTIRANMPTSRCVLSASVLDEKIYVIGGSGDVVWDLPTVEMYDPATDTWTEKADMPTGRWGLATCAVDGKIYAIGGAPNTYKGLNAVEQYDPATDTWIRKANMPFGVWGLYACVVSGKICALGGRPSYVAESYVQEYDPKTDTWTRKADMPIGTSQMASGVLDNTIVVIGGWDISSSFPYTAVQLYDPETGTWTLTADTPFRRAACSASVVNNRIYLIGGTDRPHPCPATSTVYELTINPPPPDFNGDGIIDAKDMCIMLEYWGIDEPLCDIAPAPFGDGIVGVEDLTVLAEHLFTYPGAVAYWKLDETDGDMAYDSASVNDAVVFGGAVWQPTGGAVDGALELDGVDGYASTPHMLNPGGGPFSIFTWIKGGAPGQVVISQTDGADWLCADSSQGTLATNLLPPIGRTRLPLVSLTVITDGQWHRVGFVWDGANRSLYVDGILVAEDSQLGLAECLGGLNIGCGSDLMAGTFWSGLIDDVRIYNRAVSP